MQTNSNRCTELHAFERTAVTERAFFVAETVSLYRVSDISVYSGYIFSIKLADIDKAVLLHFCGDLERPYFVIIYISTLYKRTVLLLYHFRGGEATPSFCILLTTKQLESRPVPGLHKLRICALSKISIADPAPQSKLRELHRKGLLLLLCALTSKINSLFLEVKCLMMSTS